MHYLYKVTNLINNKAYIGQTINPPRRWAQHKCGDERKLIVTSLIKRFGEHNFTFEVIACAIKSDDANYLEEVLIKQYQSNNPEFGYNKSFGASSKGLPSWNKNLPKHLQPNFGRKRPDTSVRLLKFHQQKETYLTKEEVDRIRIDYHQNNVSLSNLANLFNRDKTTISNIVYGEIYKEYSFPPNLVLKSKKIKPSKLNIQTVRLIRQDYQTRQYTTYSLADKYNRHQSTIYDIVSNKTYKELNE